MLEKIYTRVRCHLTPAVWVLVPGIVFHELTHVVVARPWAAETGVDWSGDAPLARMVWPPETPAWAVVAAHLAPVVVGTFIGSFAAATVLNDPQAVAGVSPSLAGYLALNWLAYALPSPSDVAPVVEVIQRG